MEEGSAGLEPEILNALGTFMKGEGAPTSTDSVPAKWIPYRRHSTYVIFYLQ